MVQTWPSTLAVISEIGKFWLRGSDINTAIVLPLKSPLLSWEVTSGTELRKV